MQHTTLTAAFSVFIALMSQATANGQGTAPYSDHGQYLEPCDCPKCCDAEEDEHVCYGPCDQCCPLTLFQWSRCASFTGGPPVDGPLSADRPDFTEATTTVGLGVVQLETGYTYTYDSDLVGSTKTHTYPEALLRVGILAEWLELRIGWTLAEETSTLFGVGRTSARGSEDLYLGFKIALTPQEDWLPEMVLIPQMTVPTGISAFTADEVLPGVNWVYGWELSDCISTAGQSQFNRSLDDLTRSPYTEFSQSWTVGFSLTEQIGAYTEWYCLIPDGADTNHTEHYFDGGFTFLLTDDLMFDVRGGVGLNEAADDYFLGAGATVRF